MCNNTLDEDDYKEAVRIKYEEEKEGIYSNYLSSPSPANLRDLCWKIFKSENLTTNDLIIYNDFFKFKFEGTIENNSITYTNSFKKVGKFFKGETKPAKIDTINFAAVLVDFKFRPYTNFRKHYTKEVKVIEQKDSLLPSDLDTLVVSETKEKVAKESGNLSNIENSEERTEKDNIRNEPLKVLNFFSKFSTKFKNKVKLTTIVILLVFVLVGSIVCFTFFEKGCMQWSSDHYELVYCDKPIPDNLNEVIPKDESLLNFRKIAVCDTTICFKPNEEAIVWYGKKGGNVDFFNDHGRHPESGVPLRPVTRYILGKYVYSKGIKCK